MLVLNLITTCNRISLSLFVLISLFTIAFVRCVDVKGYDLVYEPTNSKAPRAVLVDQNNNPIPSVATNAFTICLFVKLHDDGFITADLFSFSSRKADEIGEIVMESDCNEKYTDFYIHGTRTTFEAVPPFNEWTHVCVSWESKTGNARFYLNGQQTGGTRRLEQGYEIGGDGVFVLGQRQNDYNDDFDPDAGVRGVIGRFNLWNRELTQTEVQQVLSCKLEGNVISWSNSRWKLYDGLRRQTSEDVCHMKRTSTVCESNSTLETFQTFKIEFQTQINEIEQTVNGRIKENEKEITTLKQKNDQSETEINQLKQSNSQHVASNQEQEKRIEELRNELGKLTESTTQNINLLKTELKELMQNKEFCPPGFKKLGCNCYYFDMEEIVDRDEALKKCQSMNSKSTLAEIDTAEEWSKMKTYIDSLPRAWWWLGGSDSGEEGKWKWMRYKQTFGFNEAWCPNEPNDSGGNEDCLQIDYDAKHNICWNDLNCSVKLHFICEYE